MVVSLQPANLAQALFLPKDQMLQNIFYISYLKEGVDEINENA